MLLGLSGPPLSGPPGQHNQPQDTATLRPAVRRVLWLRAGGQWSTRPRNTTERRAESLCRDRRVFKNRCKIQGFLAFWHFRGSKTLVKCMFLCLGAQKGPPYRRDSLCLGSLWGPLGCSVGSRAFSSLFFWPISLKVGGGPDRPPTARRGMKRSVLGQPAAAGKHQTPLPGTNHLY